MNRIAALSTAAAFALAPGTAPAADADTFANLFTNACVETYPDASAARDVFKSAGLVEVEDKLMSFDGRVIAGAYQSEANSISFCGLSGEANGLDRIETDVLAAVSDKWPGVQITSYPPDHRNRAAHVLDAGGYKLVLGVTRFEDSTRDLFLDLHNLTPFPEGTE